MIVFGPRANKKNHGDHCIAQGPASPGRWYGAQFLKMIGKAQKGDSEQFLNRKKLLTVPFSQKSMRALNVIVRFPVAVVIRPNVVELMFKFGLPQIGLFKILIASVRNVNDRFSPILTFLLKAISKPKDAGPV